MTAYLILDDVEVYSLEQLEELIANLSDESKEGLRKIFNDSMNKIEES